MKRTLFVFTLVLLAAFLFVPSAFAAPAFPQENIPAEGLPAIVVTLLTLVGVAGLGTALANVAKKIKKPNGEPLLPDGKAPAFSLWYNLVGLIVLVALQTFGRADLVPLIDQYADLAAKAIISVSALVFQLWFSRTAHTDVLAGMPVIGTSHSGHQAGEGLVVDISQYPDTHIAG